MDKLLTVRIAAETLSVAKGTVYKLIKDGELKAVIVSGRTRVKKSDIESFIKQLGKIQPKPRYDELDEAIKEIEALNFPSKK